MKNSISSTGTPTISASCSCVFCTEWQRPIALRSGEPSHTAHGSIAIGLA